MATEWRLTDIAVLVSKYEGTSVSMMEAMAYGGVPVVTRVSGTKLIKQGVNGYCSPFGDVEHMAGIIKTIANDRTLLKKIGRNAHATVLNKYSYDQYIPDFLELNEQAWAQPSRKWPANHPQSLIVSCFFF